MAAKPKSEFVIMQTKSTNIYQAAREAAGFTQERAAELMQISLTSIKDYERDVTVPKNSVVAQMVDLYNCQLLGLQHLRSSDLGKTYLPDVRELSLQAASIALLNRINDFAKKNRVEELLTIAEDNAISESEREAFDAIVEDLNSIVQASIALRCVQTEVAAK